MKIIILGVGQVGGILVENLVGENNDIIVVDINGECLWILQDKFDLWVVQGYGSYLCVLWEVGVDDVDMLVVVISLDEINMVVCQVVYLFFNIFNCIVCICLLDYVCDVDKLFYLDVVLIDYLIVLEQLVIDNIY